MRSLPILLGARLLPVAVLTVAGLAMTTNSHSDTQPEKSAARPGPAPDDSASARPSPGRSEGSSPGDSSPATGTPAPGRYTAPPAEPCAGVPAGTVRKLVPGAPVAGKKIKASDTARRSSCSWNALDGYDYRWLDISYALAAGGRTTPPAAPGEPVAGIGDSATLNERLTTEDDQQIREAVVTVRVDNAVVTVTYNGSDFENGKAPGATEIREGALDAARAALRALD
ncbi:hypothetical protein [Streptomyces sp. NPDC018031]|uniref:hypothetical protein n=1 Tax=Streptomyces sp. NPDC018031 TaxID=3365033 RepID=UPI00378E593E